MTPADEKALLKIASDRAIERGYCTSDHPAANSDVLDAAVEGLPIEERALLYAAVAAMCMPAVPEDAWASYVAHARDLATTDDLVARATASST